jgi:hypothetical protein
MRNLQTKHQDKTVFAWVRVAFRAPIPFGAAIARLTAQRDDCLLFLPLSFRGSRFQNSDISRAIVSRNCVSGGC